MIFSFIFSTVSRAQSEGSTSVRSGAVIGVAVGAVVITAAVTILTYILIALAMRGRRGACSTTPKKRYMNHSSHISHVSPLRFGALDVPGPTNPSLELSKFTEETYE